MVLTSVLTSPRRFLLPHPLPPAARQALARGEGDPAAVKRYGRRVELQMLLMTPAEMKTK